MIMSSLERVCSVCYRKIGIGQPFQFFGNLGSDGRSVPPYVCHRCIRKVVTVISLFHEARHMRVDQFSAAMTKILEEVPSWRIYSKEKECP